MVVNLERPVSAVWFLPLILCSRVTIRDFKGNSNNLCLSERDKIFIFGRLFKKLVPQVFGSIPFG